MSTVKRSRVIRIKLNQLFLPQVFLLILITLVFLLTAFFLTKFDYPSLFGNVQSRVSNPQLSQFPSDVRETAASLVESCSKSTRVEFCYTDLFSKLTKSHKLEFALQTLSAVETIDPQTRGCHLLAHAISTAETEKDLSQWEDVLTRVPVGTCSGGFIHGVVEAKQRLDQSFVINSKTIPQICGIIKEKTKSQGSDMNCAHIMGHLAIIETLADIPKAIQMCNEIPESMHYECFSGVYMENETRDNIIAHSLGVRIPWNIQTTIQQQLLCNKETEPEANKACWRELAHMFAFISQESPLDVYQMCNQAQTEDARTECYGHAVGIMTSTSKFNTAQMKDICRPYEGDDAKFRLCYINAVGSMMQSSVRHADRVAVLCNSLPLTYTEDCYTNLGKNLSRLTTDDQRKKICQVAPDIYKPYCLGTY